MAKNFVLHSIPTRLPAAKLYLDDVTEIWRILTESCEDPETSIIVGKSQCDALKDLPDLGGRTTHLVMEISSAGKHHTLAITPKSSSVHVHETGDQVMAWSKYVKVDAIFQKRKLRLKSAVRTAWPWIAAWLWLASLAVCRFVPVPRHLTVSNWVHLVTGMALAAVILYYFISSHSIVYLRQPQRMGVWRWLEDHKPEILAGFAGILIGTLAARTLEKTVEAAFHASHLVLRW